MLMDKTGLGTCWEPPTLLPSSPPAWADQSSLTGDAGVILASGAEDLMFMPGPLVWKKLMTLRQQQHSWACLSGSLPQYMLRAYVIYC